MEERIDPLDPYVPGVASEWDVVAPRRHWRQVDGSLVLVDISGFTSLSERLAGKGRIGAEELTSVLDRVFGRMLEKVFERGGSLLKFGGDALLLLFETEDHVLQACAATVEMRSVLREASEDHTSVGRIPLKMSSGVHAGSVDLFLVGDSHRELLVTGPAASVTTEMEGTADAGEIVVSSAVRDQLPKDFAGNQKGDGWLLRKRKIHHPPAGRTSTSFVTEDRLAVLVPQALRDHLTSGIQDSEHRLATVGFVKYRGVDALIANDGPEKVGEDLQRLVAAVQDAADSEGVTFLSSDVDADGGKIILTVGVPASQPDDEGRMLRACRRILDADTRFALQVGVNRGHVFSGDVGTSFRRTYTVMGDTVNLAARLMAAAEPGMLYASPSVLDRSSTLFRTEALEPFHVKGKERSVQAYSVFEETGVRPPELKAELPFRGREPELGMLVEIVTTCAQSGRGGVMTISGDTGIGKSRLIAEVIERCPGLATLMIQAEPNGADNPYWAFRDPMRRMMGIGRSTQAEMEEALLAAIEREAPALLWALPLLGDVMHIEVPSTKRTSDIDPRFRPDRTADAMIELLSAKYPGSFAVLAEDGHWMDDASVGLLRRIGAAAETRPWTVIFTARRERSDFEPLGDEVALNPLEDAAVREIAIEVTAGAPLRPHELEAVVTRAGGNPLFLSEVLSVLRETGNIDQLPESLDAVVSTEIDTLPPLTRQLLRYASVLGRSFRRVVLDEFLAPDKIALDEATQIELGRFIEVDESARLRFRHAVVHDVAYEGLSYRRRRQLHARAGEVIERLAGDDPEAVAEFLATHYSLSGIYDKTWRYARVAAERARRTYSNTEAETQLISAIEAARHLSDIGSGEVADLWTQIGAVRDLTGRYEGARDAYSRALRGARDDPMRSVGIYLRLAEAWFGSGNITQAKRNVTLGRNHVDSADEEVRTRILARLDAYEASMMNASGDFDKAYLRAMSAVERAMETGEDEALARAYSVLDGASFMLGRDEPRRGEEAIEIYQRLGLLDRSVHIMNNMGAFAYLEGEWDEAVVWYEEAVEASERSGNIFVAALARANIAEVLIGQRRYKEAIPLLEQAERTYRASDASHFLPLVGLLSARAQVGLGRIHEAIEGLETLFSVQLGGDETAWTAETAVGLADALVEANRPAEALETLHLLETRAPDAAGQVVAAIKRVRGLALDLQGHHSAAGEALDAGLATAINASDLYQEAILREAKVTIQDRAGENPDPIDIARIDELFRLLGIVTLQPV